MDRRLDWLSFSLKCDAPVNNTSDLYLVGRGLLKAVGADHERYIYNGSGFETCTGRAPYTYALARGDNGVRIFGGGKLASILIEVSGRGCEGLYPLDIAQRFVAPLVDGVTRMDFAFDVRSNTRPSDFANNRDHNAFRSISFIRSDTGETVYVGSPKSDRFARVYRYNAPHPRHETLRVEHVFRRGLAKVTAEIFVRETNLNRFCAQMGNSWGWGHPDWQPSHQTVEKAGVPSATRDNQDTVNWLYRQVAPALRRMIKDGAIDAADWLEFVYKGLDE